MEAESQNDGGNGEMEEKNGKTEKTERRNEQKAGDQTGSIESGARRRASERGA